MSNPDADIVLGHGDIAAALVSAVELITGRGDRLIPLTNAGLDNNQIDDLLRRTIETSGASVIFTDLAAGSCNMAACRLVRWRPDLIVVTGVSLPVLLQFVMHEGGEREQAVSEAVQRGSSALRVLQGRTRAG
jgi:mannose/fructose-specific phosphotransferase system component IIA